MFRGRTHPPPPTPRLVLLTRGGWWCGCAHDCVEGQPQLGVQVGSRQLQVVVAGALREVTRVPGPAQESNGLSQRGFAVRISKLKSSTIQSGPIKFSPNLDPDPSLFPK